MTNIAQDNDATTRDPVTSPATYINTGDYVKTELGGLDGGPASDAESDASLNDKIVTSGASELTRKRKTSANNERENRMNQGAVGFGNIVTYYLMDMSNDERKLKMKKIMDELCEKN